MRPQWSSNRRTDRWLALCVLGFASAGLVPAGWDAAGKEERMNDHTPIEIRGGETHRRTVELNGNDFFHVTVEQRGIDVAVALVDATGTTVWEVDSPNGAYGPEELVAIVPEVGKYSIEVAPWDSAAAAGTVVYRELARRPATEADRELVAADRQYHALRRHASTSPRSVIDGLEPVAELWRSRGLYRREADTRIPLCDAYQATGDNPAALAACERAIEWYRAFGAEHLLAPALRRAATAHRHLGELEQAIRRSEEALGISHRLGDADGIAVSYQRLGAARRQSGELQAALDAFDQALTTTWRSPKSRAEIADERARALLALRHPREALEALRDAEAIYRQLERPRLAALALSGQAEAYVQLERFEDAARTARRAVELMVPHDDPRGRAIALNTLGRVLRHGDDLEGARRAFENALKLITDVEDPRGQAVILTELGHVLFRQRDGEAALARHQAAFELFLASRDLQGQATSRIREAQALADLGRFDQAWERLAPALDQIETTRAQTVRGDFRLAYFAFRREYVEIALDVLMELHAHAPEDGWDARALAVHDRALARELVDAVSRPSPRPVPSEMAAEEQALERRLRSLVATDGLMPPDGQRRRQVEDVLARLHQVRGGIRQTSDPHGPAATPELDVGRIQHLLGGRDLLLIYALGESKSYLWSLTRHELQAATLARRDQIEPSVAAFVIALQEDGDPEPGERLQELLLAPVAERLRGRQRLIIVADGALHTMPFAAVPAPGASRRRLVLEDHEIVMLPSLATLTARRQKRRPAPETWLALFADPIFDSSDPRLALGEAESATADAEAPASPALARSLRAMHRGRSLKRLLGTREEARAIGQLLGEQRARIYTGLEVDRQHVLEALFEHRVVHLATHGLSHPEPELSGLVLSLVDETGRPRDGFLQTLEIARLDIDADLVVLSACETARGKVLAGEGTLGLAWAFLHAGAARVMASLWPVSDTGTARLMTHFYQSLDRGLAPAAALRKAQLTVAARPETTPYDWAAFIVQGDWRRPEGSSPSDERLAPAS